MIPQTAGALLAFLGLIAPGALFEIQREKRVPRQQRSAFREASSVALASLGFTTFALVLFSLARLVIPDVLADPRAWFALGSRYVADNFYIAGSTLLIIVLLACVSSLGASWLLDRFNTKEDRANLEKVSLWFMAIRRERKPGSNPWAHVQLKSGESFYGYVKNYSAQLEVSAREIQLIGPELTYRPARRESGYQRPDKALPHWDSVVIERKDIVYLKIQHKVD